MLSHPSTGNQQAPAGTRRQVETIVVPVPEPLHPQSRAVIGFWQKHCVDGRLLSRANLPCRETVSLLPSIFVLERMDEAGEDWRIRLVGTHLTRQLDFDPTGFTISAFFHPDSLAHNASVYRAVTEERRMHITHGRLHGVNRDFLRLEIVHLPMEGTAPDDLLLLGCISIFDN
jgi:hypothetical protein